MSKHRLELTDIQVYALFASYGEADLSGPYIPLTLKHGNTPENIPFMLESIQNKLDEIEKEEIELAKGEFK